MFVDTPRRKIWQRDVMFLVDIFLVQFNAVDQNLSVSDLDRFSGKADNAFYKAFVGIVRVPKDDDIAAFDMAPANGLYFVIDQLIYEQSFAVVKLWHHRRAFDHDRLDKENAKENKDKDDQKNVASELKTLRPKAVSRFTANVCHLDIRVILDIDRAERDMVFAAKIEHSKLQQSASVPEGQNQAAPFLSSDSDTAFVKVFFKMNNEIRDQFAATRHYSYLNSAAISPIPRAAAWAIESQLDDVATHGSAHYNAWVETKGRCRELLASMLSVPAEHIGFIRNTSDGFSTIANGLSWSEGDNIVSFENEFPSNYYAWRRIRDEFGVELRLASESDGRVDMAELISMIDAGTRVVAISAVQFSSGFAADLGRIGKAAKEAGALFCVDIIQGLGARGYDLPALGVDVVCGASHKWLCGPEGIGYIYLSERARELVPPTLVGWISVDDEWNFVDREQAFKPNALAWESGTGPASLYYGLEQSLRLLTETGLTNIENYLDGLSTELCGRLTASGHKVISSRIPGESSAVVCMQHRDGIPSLQVAKHLAAEGVVVSPRGDRLRISPHFYNNESDLDRLMSAMP